VGGQPDDGHAHAVAADGRRAVGISPEGMGYRFTGSMLLDETERRVVDMAPHAAAGTPRA
jgi:hypothetical protein